MAGVSLGGVNLDVQGIVSQLMELENAPLDKLVEDKASYDSQVSELGKLKSAMTKFQSSMENLSSLSKFEQYAVSTSESDTDKSYTVKTDDDATAGIFSVEVLSLANSNKYGTLTDNGFNDINTTSFTASDNLVISDDGGVTDMSIDISGKTLSQIRDEINDNAASADIGVSASIVAANTTLGASEFHLVLTATETGTDNEIDISGSGANTLAELKLSETQTALNASVKIDNTYTISSATNTITDAISGVDLTLIKESTTASELKITRDTDAVKKSIEEFTSSYNTLRSNMKIYEDGDLKGNPVFNSIRNSMRNVLNTSAGSGTYNYLSEIGVTSDSKTGELSLNSTTFDKALASDYAGIAKLFATEDTGVAYQMDALMEEYVKSDGLIFNRTDALSSRIRLNGKQQESWESRLELKRASFLKQFSALDGLIGQMSSTSQALSGQLASLPGFA